MARTRHAVLKTLSLMTKQRHMQEDGTIDFDARPTANEQGTLYEKHIREIKRREAATNAPGVQNTELHLPYSSLECLDPEEQRFVLLSLGTRVLAPRPLNHLFPALRVYGCFSDKEEAVDHAEIVRKLDERCSLIVAQCGDWVLFPQSEEVRDCPETAKRRTLEKMTHHEQTIRDEHAEFEAAMQQKKERKVKWDKSEWTDELEQEADAVSDVYRRPRRLKAGAEVRGHAFFAAAVIPDHKDGEVMVNILGCFATQDDAVDWIDGVSSRSQTSHDIFIQQTCEWVYPNGTTVQTQKDHYRTDEVQKIMNAARANPKNVKSFKKWKKEQDAEKLIQLQHVMKERRARALENEERRKRGEDVQDSEEILTDKELEARFAETTSEFGIDLTK